MDRVEGPAEDPDRARHRRHGRERLRRRQRHRPSSTGSHSSSSRRSVTVSPGRTPGAAQRLVDPEPREVPLEALGGLLVLEVGLVDEPLDPLPAHVEAVVLPLERVAVAGGLEPVDDDARGLGRLGEPRGIGQQLRERGEQRVEALARCRRRSRAPAGPARRIAASNAGPRLARRRQVELVEHGELRLLQQRGVVRLELVADDLVVPARRRGPPRRRCGAAGGSAPRGAGTRGRAPPGLTPPRSARGRRRSWAGARPRGRGPARRGSAPGS